MNEMSYVNGMNYMHYMDYVLYVHICGDEYMVIFYK